MRASHPIKAICYLLLALTAEGSAAARKPAPDVQCARRGLETDQRFAQVQGLSIAYVRCGAGAPTIVFEMGFGGNLEPWQDVFPRVAQFAPAFAYSRPNRGRSTGQWAADEDGVRTSDEAARLLHDVWAAASVPPPYLLVGVSLGGLYVQKFAQLFPGQTAGLVLLDNRPATYMRACAAAGVRQCLENEVDPSWSASTRSTFLGIAPSESVAPSAEQLGDLPVLVITAGRTDMVDAEAFVSGMRDAQRAFATRLKRGRHYLAKDATHDSLIHAQAGEVVDQIQSFWRQIAARGH